MVDVKKIIQDMARRGMSEEQIIGTLKELGVPNAEEVFREATEKLKEVAVAPPEGAPPPPPVEEKPVEIEVPEEEKKPVPDLEKIMKEAAPAAPEEVKELRQKLDEITSLLKALQNTLKQVLETDRSVLLRLKKE